MTADPLAGIDDRYQRAHLTLLAGIQHELTRIADGQAERPVHHLAVEEALEAWEAIGMRMYEDKALEYLKQLGVQVD